MVLAKEWGIDKWNRIQSSEIGLCIYSQVIFDKGALNTMEQRQSFQK